jgi:hypothetical protein
MTAGTAAFLLNAFVMLYAMFFFLRDGESILQRESRAAPGTAARTGLHESASPLSVKNASSSAPSAVRSPVAGGLSGGGKRACQ